MQKLSVTMTRGEQRMGLCYLLFSQLLFPYLLAAVLPALFPGCGALTVNLVYFIFNFLSVCAIFWRFLWKSLCALADNGARMIAVVAIGYLAHQLMLILVGLVVTRIRPDFSNVNDATVSQLAARNYPIMLVATTVLAPVTEEPLYRGVLFGTFYQKKPIWAYLISVPVFCLIHILGYIGAYDVPTLALCFVQYIPAGLCLGWAYHKADNIFAPIFIHMLVNAGSMFALR